MPAAVRAATMTTLKTNHAGGPILEGAAASVRQPAGILAGKPFPWGQPVRIPRMCPEKLEENKSLTETTVDSFVDLDLSDEMLEALKAANYRDAHPHPSRLDSAGPRRRIDVVGQAQNGNRQDGRLRDSDPGIDRSGKPQQGSSGPDPGPDSRTGGPGAGRSREAGPRIESSLRRDLRRHAAPRSNRKAGTRRRNRRRHTRSRTGPSLAQDPLARPHRLRRAGRSGSDAGRRLSTRHGKDSPPLSRHRAKPCC